MDISALITHKIAASGKVATTGMPQAALSGGTGVFAFLPGMSFMDLIFVRQIAAAQAGVGAQTGTEANGEAAKNPANLLETLMQKLAQNGAVLPVQTDEAGNPVEQTPEQMLQALLEIDPATLEGIATPQELTALQTLQKIATPDLSAALKTGAPVTTLEGKKKVAALLDSLLAGIPQDNKPVIFEITKDNTVNILGKDENGAPALIATGLTPEKLTEILKDIADGNPDGAAFSIATVQIVPAETNNKGAMFLPRGIVAVQPQHPAGEIATPQQGGEDTTDQLAAKLNALTVGQGEALPSENNDFENIMKVLERAQSGKAQPQNDANNILNNIAAKTAHAVKAGAGNSTIPGLTSSATGQISTDMVTQTLYPEGFDFSINAPHGMTLTTGTQLTSLISNAPQAVYPHPAAQMVAATIAKATIAGESKNITIHLDPPELGKVHVKMEIGKDNSVKAHMVIEKPETYLMLQRDAHVLQRALNEAGMDAGSAGLSFELSQDSNFFQQDQHNTGGNSGGGSDDAGEGAPIETIETRMDWTIDPATGLMRYDALV